MAFFKKIFNHEYKQLEKFKSIADKIIELDDEMSKLTDEELTTISSYSRADGRLANQDPEEHEEF